MSQDLLPKTYDPVEIESKWYDIWIKTNCFKADENKKKP